MTIADLPPLREALDEVGLTANKTFGQHFLLDLNITHKIARLAGPLEGKTVIEVGPGPGGLTRALLEAGAQVIAIEKDRRFEPVLASLSQAAMGALHLVFEDAMTANEAALMQRFNLPGPASIIANLPYNVGTPLLINWLTGPFRPASMCLMFQREVAQRIVAKPGEDAYGRLAVIVQATAEAKIIMDLPARAFTPPPKVDSAVVRLDLFTQRTPDDLLHNLQKITAAAFGQRRKMLRSSLKALGGQALCEAANLDSTCRAEEIDLAGFLRLAVVLNSASF